MHRQAVALLCLPPRPPFFLDGCRYLVEVLSLPVIRALPEGFSLSLDLLVSHTPSFPVPQSSPLGPFARLGSATLLQLPCLTIPWSSISVVGLILLYCFNPYLLPLLPDETYLFEHQCFSATFSSHCHFLPRKVFSKISSFHRQRMAEVIWSCLLVSLCHYKCPRAYEFPTLSWSETQSWGLTCTLT